MMKKVFVAGGMGKLVFVRAQLPGCKCPAGIAPGALLESN